MRARRNIQDGMVAWLDFYVLFLQMRRALHGTVFKYLENFHCSHYLEGIFTIFN